MIRDVVHVDTLGTRRLRAAKDMAYASIRYGEIARAATKYQRADAHPDCAVQAAAAYVTQTRSAYEDARADHEHALYAACDSLCALGPNQEGPLAPAPCPSPIGV